MEAKHFDILISKKLNVADLKGDFELTKTIRIHPTNKMVNGLNSRVVTHYRNQGAQIFRIKAQDELLDRNPRNNTNMDKLVPKEGGLVNGSMGVITQITIITRCMTMTYQTFKLNSIELKYIV
ncbi:hypothetical protein NPIL_556611 [Nephila pilipes]|uniref:Uncharacterized protein n=1 Tax=Nephila pilipes TaxID=299642 RepID=A0A8X6JVQ2_NEPPI|nr:hypothetical protein NPIL_488951 [Nephila pilipes]GFS62079.1 hypothetical protein NPIL_557881 [Nephila pilipes]GFT85017.1 hypothetical protein NPIL_161351 [Nephila pilipes]GFU43737.1 hypothetical protein NPIL_556611 [Nephila pilipes]